VYCACGRQLLMADDDAPREAIILQAINGSETNKLIDY
jgi:hypothetical protein